MTFFGRVLSSEGRYTLINIHDGIWYFISSYFDRVIHDGKDIQGKFLTVAKIVRYTLHLKISRLKLFIKQYGKRKL